jgi:hypothetical protein
MGSHDIEKNRHAEGEDHGFHKHPHEADIMPTETREHLAHNERADYAALGVEALGEGVGLRSRGRRESGGWHGKIGNTETQTSGVFFGGVGVVEVKTLIDAWEGVEFSAI